jgi:hypothetical protein
VFVEIINHFEKPILEKLVSTELKWLYFELLTHDLGELINEELVALELHLLVPLDTLVPGRVEEVEGGDGVGVEPEDDGQGELCEGDDQNDGVRDELDHIDLDPLRFRKFVPREFIRDLILVEVGDPLNVIPKVLGPLDDGVLGLLEYELALEHQRLLAIGVELLLELLHLVVVEQPAPVAVGQQTLRLTLQRTTQHHLI